MLVYLSLAWLAGVALNLQLDWPIWSAGLVISGALIWWGIWKQRHTMPGQTPHPAYAGRPNTSPGQTHWSAPTVMVIGLCIIAFLSAGLRIQDSKPLEPGLAIADYNGKGIVEIAGMVGASPELKERGLEIRLQVNKLKDFGEWKPVSGAVLLRAERFAPYQYGDMLRVQGKLEIPPQFPSFDYRAYLARQGITSIVYQPKIELVESGYGNWFLRNIYILRQRLAESLTRSLPEPQAALTNGILLGLRGDIPKNINDAFARSGTTHLLAISGQNITILAGIILGLAVWALGRQRPTYLILALAIVWVYAFLVGGQPPVIRAAIMASLFLLAEYIGRLGSAPTALALSAAVMVGISPHIVWDTSFQLSFLSMAGLIYLAPRFQKLGERLHILLPISISLSVSLGAILATWPVIAYDFGRISLAGLPATILAAPALPAIMITSGLAAIGGMASITAGIVLGWVAWLPLSYLLWVSQGFAALPAASISVQSVPAGFVLWYYSHLTGILILAANRQRLKPFYQKIWNSVPGKFSGWVGKKAILLFERVSWKWATFILAPIAILLWTAGLTMPARGKLEVSFLNVSQGEATLIRTPANRYILIDGGGSGQSLNVELGKKLPFWQRKLDLVVLTSRKPSHMEGLWDVLQRYKVKELWQVTASSPKPATQFRGPVSPAVPSISWEDLVAKRDNHAVQAQRGLKLKEGDYLTLEVLEPVDFKGVSAVLRLQVGDVSFLFTSDIGESVERKLMADRMRLESTVLKVANYGGASSTSEGFLARVNPAVGVMTGGIQDGSGHPSADVMERLKQKVGESNIYMTWQHGDIDFTSDGRRLWVSSRSKR